MDEEVNIVKVKELIEKLKTFDPDLPVYIVDRWNVEPVDLGYIHIEEPDVDHPEKRLML
jgi:hypothetical protein